MSETQNLSIGAKLREAGSHTIIYGLGSIAQSASGLILLPILTSSLSGDDFGAYSLILMASSIANAIFYFGMTSALPRSYFDFESNEDRKSVTTTAFAILLLGALVQTTIGYIYRMEISMYLLGNEIYGEAIFYGLLSGAAVFVNTFLFGYLRLVKKSIASVLFSLMSLTGVIGLTIFFQNINPEHAVAPFMALLYANIIVTLAFMVMYGRSAFNFKIIKLEIPVLLNLGAASIVASFGGLMIDSLDRIMIQKYFGLVEAGQFSAAIRVGMLVNVLFVVPFNQIWSPMALEYRHKKNINQLFARVFTIYMMLGGLLTAVASIFGWQILSFLIKSEVTTDMVYVFNGCLIGVLVMSTTNFFSAGLFYERKVSQLSIAYYGTAFVKFLVSLFLIPIAGLIGAVVSCLISSTLVPMIVRRISKKYFQFDIEWHTLIKFYILLAPSLLYGIYSANGKPNDFSLSFLILFIQILIIIIFGFSKTEKILFSEFMKK
jgi:O-antigen/teichoic acid export membrane protein